MEKWDWPNYYVEKTYKSSLAKSPLGKACAYCMVRWDKQINYIHDGSLEIDDNLAENAIRPITPGRKTWIQLNQIGYN